MPSRATFSRFPPRPTLDAVEDSALLLTVALALAAGAGPGYSWQEDWQ